jgi:hypothetical protein
MNVFLSVWTVSSTITVFMIISKFKWNCSRDSSVSIVTMSLTGRSGVRILAGGSDLPSTPALGPFYRIDTEVVSLGLRRPGGNVDHSPPSSAEDRAGGASTHLLLHAVSAWTERVYILIKLIRQIWVDCFQLAQDMDKWGFMIRHWTVGFNGVRGNTGLHDQLSGDVRVGSVIELGAASGFTSGTK